MVSAAGRGIALQLVRHQAAWTAPCHATTRHDTPNRFVGSGTRVTAAAAAQAKQQLSSGDLETSLRLSVAGYLAGLGRDPRSELTAADLAAVLQVRCPGRLVAHSCLSAETAVPWLACLPPASSTCGPRSFCAPLPPLRCSSPALQGLLGDMKVVSPPAALDQLGADIVAQADADGNGTLRCVGALQPASPVHLAIRLPDLSVCPSTCPSLQL